MKTQFVLAAIVGLLMGQIAPAVEPMPFSFTNDDGLTAIADDDLTIFTLTMPPEILVIESFQFEITNLSHTHPADLDIWLLSPFNTDIRIMGDSGNGFAVEGVDLTFSDASEVLLPDDGQIVSGTYKPAGLASGRDGGFADLLQSNGGWPLPWTLIVVDDDPVGTGDFGSFTFSGTYTPEPATLSLLALGALAILRRRRRS